jgi:hypothetical protein
VKTVFEVLENDELKNEFKKEFKYKESLLDI